MITIRPVEPSDAAAIGALAEQSGLFPAGALPAMMAPFLEGDGEAEWLVSVDGDEPIAFLYAEPEFLTIGTYNLRAMATSPANRGAGVGTALIRQVEQRLADREGRILLVETSSTPAFAETRRFYTARGFREEARIRGYWNEGDDKITFWKRLKALGGE